MISVDYYFYGRRNGVSEKMYIVARTHLFQVLTTLSFVVLLSRTVAINS